jgi:peptide/nickel transport system substrate-binding protein
MAEAGYANGFEFTMDCLNQTPFGEVCQAVAGMLPQIGINVKLNMVSFTNIFPKLQKYDTSAYAMGYAASTMDAHTVLSNVLQSVGKPGSSEGDSNWGGVVNPALDSLIKRIKVEMDLVKRDQLIREALLMQRDTLPVIALYQVEQAWGLRKNIEAPVVPNNTPYFYRFKRN